MKFDRNLIAALLALTLLLAPAMAEARAGGSMRMGGGMSYQSQGSRGSRTYNYDGAQPFQRSITPNNPAQGYSPYAYYGGGTFWNRHPFLSTLAGGFFGAWLGHMLFPGWGFGGVFVGSIFSWLLIIFVVSSFFRNFRHHMVPTGDTAAYYQPNAAFMPAYQGGSAPLSLTAPDYSEFEQVLKAVQAAWSRADLSTLRHLVTPEMLSYFAEELANNTSQGVQNQVEDVTLLNGDLREAWDEGQLQYATAQLRWSARDFTIRAGRNPGDPEVVVEGDPQHPVIAEEMWTFARSHGGHWLLSAIQQI